MVSLRKDFNESEPILICYRGWGGRDVSPSGSSKTLSMLTFWCAIKRQGSIMPACCLFLLCERLLCNTPAEASDPQIDNQFCPFPSTNKAARRTET